MKTYSNGSRKSLESCRVSSGSGKLPCFDAWESSLLLFPVLSTLFRRHYCHSDTALLAFSFQRERKEKKKLNETDRLASSAWRFVQVEHIRENISKTFFLQWKHFILIFFGGLQFNFREGDDRLEMDFRACGSLFGGLCHGKKSGKRWAVNLKYF